MKKVSTVLFFLFFLVICFPIEAQDTIAKPSPSFVFKGQISAWGHYNPEKEMQINSGIRYIPNINTILKFKNEHKLDFEASANFLCSNDMRTFDSISFNWNAKPYRLWTRYSTRQSEIRLGMQKINFGSATLIRPLMWFDQLDPRDPQQLTNGLWGALGRYYFLNNANIWLWVLYGNNQQRPWDLGLTPYNKPEYGGRIQLPVPKGEIALTYHYRKADISSLPLMPQRNFISSENRTGFDAKWDLGVGLWTEAVWIHKNEQLGNLNNQEIINTGIDYTFSIGNGLNIVCENVVCATDEKAFRFSNIINLTALAINYPLTIDDVFNVISFYDWKNRASYNFVNYKHKINNLSVNFMAYINPENYMLPQYNNSDIMFAGKGIQIMFIYNH